ncbi:hypothetical protein THAOC_29290 [Thalassiosira oceanica]|uniref:Uncharacterized protein n=1 Tax=Thalassiosira oceanica TaxID=159749 RepID=K0RE85_THAOC|nr:hypothetical protein THAOC_29290 [Thalassiosira oceanica]|eukprot:EJK51530.1 hypothetical protein THAOC_29290 [Thalassiosira oceanica]
MSTSTPSSHRSGPRRGRGGSARGKVRSNHLISLVVSEREGEGSGGVRDEKEGGRRVAVPKEVNEVSDRFRLRHQESEAKGRPSRQRGADESTCTSVKPGRT